MLGHVHVHTYVGGGGDVFIYQVQHRGFEQGEPTKTRNERRIDMAASSELADKKMNWISNFGDAFGGFLEIRQKNEGKTIFPRVKEDGLNSHSEVENVFYYEILECAVAKMSKEKKVATSA